MNSPSQQAIGALRLAKLYTEHPGVTPARVVRDACCDAIELLQHKHPHAEDLVRLYVSLLSVTPRGCLPYVTLTNTPATPYACVITDATGNVIDRQVGKSVEGITEMIRVRLRQNAPTASAEGRGEAGGVQ